MQLYQTSDIRNIAVIGGSGSGKTTLAEAMLFESGVIKRRGTIEAQNTVCDYFPVEKEYGYTVFSPSLVSSLLIASSTSSTVQAPMTSSVVLLQLSM